MNLDALRTRVRVRLQVPDDDALFPDAVLDELLNEGMRSYESEYDWPSLQRTYRFNTVADKTDYALPFDAEAVRVVKVDGYEYTPVGIVDADDLCAWGTFGVWADKLILPALTAGASVVVRYHALDPTMDNDNDEPSLPEQYQGGIVSYAAYLGFTRVKQDDHAAVAMNEYKNVVARHRRGSQRIRGPRVPRVTPGSMV